MPQLATDPELVLYPSSDGQPMGETWLHVRAIMHLHQALEDFFKARTDALIALDMFWYWEKGNPKAVLAPDVMVVLGLRNPDPPSRRSYFSWKENDLMPAIVFEMASANTWKEDLEEKVEAYASLGVPEYFLFDPEAIYLHPSVQGFRLKGNSYRRIPSKAMESRLGFRLRAEGTLLRLIDTKSGHPIPTRAEAMEAAQQRAESERHLRESERQLLESERQLAQAEKQRADRLAAEVERLKQQLGRSGS